MTDHLKTFGAIEVSRRHYHKLLEAALVGEADFAALQPQPMTGAEALRLRAGAVQADYRSEPAARNMRRGRDCGVADWRRLLQRGCCRGAAAARRAAAAAAAARWCCAALRRRGAGAARRRLGGTAGGVRAFTVGQPDVVDRMLDRVAAPGSRQTSSR